MSKETDGYWYHGLFFGGIVMLIPLLMVIGMWVLPLQSQLAECQEVCGSELFEKELERDLLFYHDTNRGLHFLDDEGCEWRIVIEPATAYVNCKAVEEKE